MIAESTRRFDLYDFFSILIPGATLLISLTPFLPPESDVFSIGGLGMLLILSFVTGRAMHALGIYLEQRPSNSLWGIEMHQALTTNHRDVFKKELRTPTKIDDSLVDAYYLSAVESFPKIGLPESREKVTDATSESLYAVTRAFIHADARGRSRTFQALLDFQRTMVVTAVMLLSIYGGYAMLGAFNLLPTGLIGYQPYIVTLDLSPSLIFFIAAVVSIGSYWTFERIRTNYRRYYIEYLMADFIVLRQSG